MLPTKKAKSGPGRAVSKRKKFASQARWREANPKKVWAQAALRSALKRGFITQQPCEVCGNSNSEAHHDDYDKPADVRWLCRQHHKALHATNTRASMHDCHASAKQGRNRAER